MRANHERSVKMDATGMDDRSAESAAEQSVGDPAQDWLSQYGIRHIAIIPDGNRRWARGHSFPIAQGHSVGLLDVLPALVEELSRAGVHTLTAWGFSTENWHRAHTEVEHLMTIFAEFLAHRLMEMATEFDARVVHLGRKDRLPSKVLERLVAAETATLGNTSHVYNIALDYGGDDELTRAAGKMLDAARTGTNATELRISDFLDTSSQPFPQPDIVIRSSGELRLSGFLPLQTAYSELFFVEESFPEFTMDVIRRVAEEFRQRRRRFGE